MERSNYGIRSYCSIRGRSVRVDGNSFLTADPAMPLGDFLKSAYRKLAIDYPKFHKMDGLCKAIFVAAELIARASGPYKRHTALVFANRSSSYLSDSRHAHDIFRPDDPQASPATFVYTLPNIAMGEISIRHQLQSENVFFIFDSYLPEFMVPYVHATLDGQQSGKGVLCGWTEVTEETCDLLLYRIGTSGKLAHSIAQLKKLYNEEDE
ncbi:hypothetical protein [Parapedobacter sp. 2B3]|uniref:hypothetical protein n=1 Tax=Parapedobacter sp. 2B3 TaxID=3342381 RepID=UPI0035B60FDE